MSKKRSSTSSFNRKRVPEQSSARRIPTWGWFTIGGVAAVLLVVGLLYLGQRGTAQATANIEGVVVYPDPGRSHQEGEINYDRVVPVGGPHNPQWQNCGIYIEPVREELAIHSMEHGAVWIAYRPDLPADQVAVLQDLVRGESWTVLAPKPDLPTPVVATAWRVQLELEDANDERLPLFLRRYQLGPLTPELGAPCTGGVGDPV